MKIMKKYNKIYKIQPREKRGRLWVIAFFIATFSIYVGCSEFCSQESFQFHNILNTLVSNLAHLVVPLVPLHLAIYLIHFRKAGYELKIFNKFFARIKIYTKASVSVLVMSIFLVIVLDENSKLNSNKLLNLVIQSFAAALAVILFDWLKIQRNIAEDEEIVERAKHHVAPGLAMAYFRYIQNVVHGVVDEDGNEINKPHEEALQDYIKNEELKNEIGCARNWISEKILILFPESEHIRGSVQDIAVREKDKGENHCLTMDPIMHKYQAAGQPRKSVLDVIKIQDNQITVPYRCSGKCPDGSTMRSIDADRTQTTHMHNRESLLDIHTGGSCQKLHERKEWQNNYVIFAENRPLNTLYQMVDAPGSQISFDRKDFELQFKLYYNELKRLIEEDEVCREKVELFLFQDYASKETGNFSSRLKKQIKKMKMRDQSSK